MRWKRRARRRLGKEHGAQPRASSLLHRGEFIAAAAMKSRGGWRKRWVKSKRPAEVNAGIERIFSYAAWADKFDGAVHNPPFRNIAIAMHEAIGTVGVICPAGSAAAGIFLGGDAVAGDGECGGGGAVGKLSADYGRYLSSVRDQRFAGRSDEYRDGATRRNC